MVSTNEQKCFSLFMVPRGPATLIGTIVRKAWPATSPGHFSIGPIVKLGLRPR